MHTCRSCWLLPCSPHIGGTSGACVLLAGRKTSPGDAYYALLCSQTIKTTTPQRWNFPRNSMLEERKVWCSWASQRRPDSQEKISELWKLVPSCPLFKTKSYVRTNWTSLDLFVPHFNVTVLNGSPFFLYLPVFICLIDPVRTDVQAWLVRLSVSRFWS